MSVLEQQMNSLLKEHFFGHKLFATWKQFPYSLKGFAHFLELYKLEPAK